MRGLSPDRVAEMELRLRQQAEAKVAHYPERPSDEERAQAVEDEKIIDRLMPTRLGNVLRVGEDFAGDRFGLDAVRVVPYLINLAPAPTVELVEDARTELDVAVKFVYVWMACSTFSLVAFANDGLWLLAPVACFGFGILSYDGAIRAARDYTDALARLVDLHRFDLTAALHWPLPENPQWERLLNDVIWRHLGGDATPAERRMPYQHHRSGDMDIR